MKSIGDQKTIDKLFHLDHVHVANILEWSAALLGINLEIKSTLLQPILDFPPYPFQMSFNMTEEKDENAVFSMPIFALFLSAEKETQKGKMKNRKV